jgi:hypothetical protein
MGQFYPFSKEFFLGGIGRGEFFWGMGTIPRVII